MKKADLNIYTSDGRIDANKAFKLVYEKMVAMTNEEFRKLVEMPVPMRGSDGSMLPGSSGAANKKTRVTAKKSAPIKKALSAGGGTKRKQKQGR